MSKSYHVFAILLQLQVLLLQHVPLCVHACTTYDITEILCPDEWCEVLLRVPFDYFAVLFTLKQPVIVGGGKKNR